MDISELLWNGLSSAAPLNDLHIGTYLYSGEGGPAATQAVSALDLRLFVFCRYAEFFYGMQLIKHLRSIM